MHDISDFELRGVPGVFVASDEFESGADIQSMSLGFASMARVFTPHPVQDRTDAEIVAYADDAYVAIVTAITSPSATAGG